MSDKIKVITIWQPYATLLVEQQFKHFETRGWATSYTGPIAIHAAKRPVRQTLRLMQPAIAGVISGLLYDVGEVDNLPTGAIIGMGNLVRCNPITEDFVANLSMTEKCLGDYSPGRFAWEFSGLHPITPIPATGKQGIWNWEGKLQ